MYEWLEIKGFRGIRELRIEGLRRVNVFLGANGSGKSTVLEAIALLCTGNNAEFPMVLNQMREISYPRDALSLAALFSEPSVGPDVSPAFSVEAGPHDGAECASLDVRGVEQTGPSLHDQGNPFSGGTKLVGLRSQCTVRESQFDRTDVFPLPEGVISRRHAIRSVSLFLHGAMVSSDQTAFLFGRSVQLGNDDAILSFAREVGLPVTKLAVVPLEQGKTALAAVVEPDGFLPAEVLGEGAVRMLRAMLACCHSQKGALLLDEIDSGLHHTVMLPYLRALRTATAEWQTQLFATTHNMELLRYLREAFAGEPDALMIYRLERRGEAHQVVEIDFEGLEVATEARWEIR